MAINISDPFSVLVNHDLDIYELLKMGNYKSVDKEINKENCLEFTEIEGDRKEDIFLVGFDESHSLNSVAKAIEIIDFRFANIPEILFFGLTHPNEQMNGPIICGSYLFWRKAGNRGVLVLNNDLCGNRIVELLWHGNSWESHFRFACVSKKNRLLTSDIYTLK